MEETSLAPFMEQCVRVTWVTAKKRTANFKVQGNRGENLLALEGWSGKLGAGGWLMLHV